MKILIICLLLFTGLNQILARSIPWITMHGGWLDDDDYDLLRLPEKEPNNDFYDFLVADNKEESKELKQTTADVDKIGHIGGFFGALFGSNIVEDEINSEEKPQIESSEKSERKYNSRRDELDHILDELFGNDEEKISKDNEESKSSEETIKNENSNENSDEVTSNLEVHIIDFTKSSEETFSNENKIEEPTKEEEEITDMTRPSIDKKIDVVNNLSESEFNEIASFIISLNIINELGDIINGAKNKDDDLRAKEVDEILIAFDTILDNMIQDDRRLKNTNTETMKQINSNEKEDENSEEDDSNETIITTTTPENDSNENDADNNQDDSNSNANDFKIVSFILQDTNGQAEPINLNEHKYSVIETQQPLKPTTAPFLPETVSTSSANDQNSVHEYVEIRENLDTQQNSLQKHELDLDKDFYNIISKNYDDASLQKFETDIYVAHEHLDRIKRNINAMQNLQSKLYLHKLVTAAVQNKITN